jgi:geranylgeranyl pyrophosphate synthase
MADATLGGSAAVIGGGEPLWALLPLLACASAAGGTSDVAVPLAVAVEMQTAAYRLLDDLEDGDVNALIRRAGLPVACNLATTLLSLTQRALLRVPAAAADVMAAGWLAACVALYWTTSPE